MGDVRAIVAGLFVKQSDPALRDYVIDDMSAAPLRVAKSSIRGLQAYDQRRAIAALRVPLFLINADFLPTDLASIEAAGDTFR